MIPSLKLFSLYPLAAVLLVCSGISAALAQVADPATPHMQARNGMNATPRNYTSFTPLYHHASAEAISRNSGYESDPELGTLFAETPCNNCYELIGKRTETSKTFIKEGTNGSDIMQQTSSAPMHLRDAAGNWKTIQAHLAPDAAHMGTYAAYDQETPVLINATGHFSAMGNSDEQFRFNNALELIYSDPSGIETSLGAASWAHYTAGDDGVYVTDAWPGVDMEMYTIRGAVKTNFIINHAMPAYAAGKLLVRDHMLPGSGFSVYTAGRTDFTDNIAIRNAAGTTRYIISAANAYEKNTPKTSYRQIAYHVAGNDVDIVLPGDFLGRTASAYPVIIDPLVSTPTSSTITGSSYSVDWTVPCVYNNAATVPANVTITDIQWSFNYITSGGAWLNEGAVDFRLGTCRSPTGPTGTSGIYWSCAGIGAGTCTGSNVSIYSDISSCVPVPQCPSYNLNMVMDFYQDYSSTAACASTYVSAAIPLTITVFGHTVEFASSGSASATPATICADASSSLSALGTYGVAPYTYTWTPGPLSGSPASVSPATTTTYTVTLTDACGISTTSTATVVVNPISPIAGSLTPCVGNTTALTNATGTGTWSSSTTSVATVISSTGVVTGVSAGTSTITFTTSAGCHATAVVTVSPVPSALTGTMVLCSGNSSTLSGSIAGGTWSSSNTSVASVSASGVVTGVAGGTSTITYSMGGSCYVTADVTVNPTPVIGSTSFTNPTTCGGSDGTITLSGLNSGEAYTVTYTSTSAVSASITADASGNVVITGLHSGTYATIKVTTAAGCVSNVVGPITLIDAGTPAIPVATANNPCEGGALNLSATDVTAGVAYSWSGPGGYSSPLQNPTVNPAAIAYSGTYSVTATIGGCTSAPATVTVTIHPLPHITGFTTQDPSTCLGADGAITLAGLLPAQTYTLTYTYNGSPAAPGSYTANASGNIVLSGFTSGIYDLFVAASVYGCVSTAAGPATLIDPLAPPVPQIMANTPLCVGQTLQLTATDGMAGGIYTWTGPNGFTYTGQSPAIAGTTAAAEGVYSVTYSVSNCPNSSSLNIPLYPAVHLTNVTPLSVIPYGSSIQLNSMGAVYYQWTPSNGSLSDPTINNPVATPLDSTTYTVYGMSEHGCKDSATVTILVDAAMEEYVPTAFTPNGDGLNDLFRVRNLKYQRLVDFSIFNRWGQLVYHTTNGNNDAGWNGNWNGEPQDMGVYNYVIVLAVPNGPTKTIKGTVTLVR